MRILFTATVAAVILPAVELGRPARRTLRAKKRRRWNSPELQEIRRLVPGGEAHALYVRRDARRYKSQAGRMRHYLDDAALGERNKLFMPSAVLSANLSLHEFAGAA